MAEILDVKIQAGKSVDIGDQTITPFAQTVQVSLPGITGGFIWNRPVSVLVQTENGQEEVLPVTDVTRQAIFGLIGSSLGALLIIWLISRIVKLVK